MKNKKIKLFVTGGSGFIGQHVIESLQKYNNVSITSLDVIYPNKKLKNVKYLLGTIMDKPSLIKMLKGHDKVLHLAAAIGVRKTAFDELNCLNVNIVGTVNILDACLVNRIKDILITSSSEVYGDVNKKPVHEKSPFNPKSTYAVSKLSGEKYALAYASEFSLRPRIVRFFNIYGPGQSKDFVVSKFAQHCKMRKKITVYGDGSQIRAFCYVKDAADATAKIILSNRTSNKIYNIGNDKEPISILDLAKRFCKLNNLDKSFIKKIDFKYSDRSSTREIYKRIPDITKIKENLDYDPVYKLDDGIKLLMESVNNEKNNPGLF